MITQNLIVFVFIIGSAQAISAQNDSLHTDVLPIIDINTRDVNELQKKYSDFQSTLDKQSARLLTKMFHKEEKLWLRLTAIDSIKAKQLFNSDVRQQYRDLQSGFSTTTDKLKCFPLKEYIPDLDSVLTSLNFFTKNPNLPTDKLKQLQSLSVKLNGLQQELQQANEIQSFITERQAVLKKQLANTRLVKKLKGINKEAYYYQARLAEYKELLNDKEKLK